MSSLATRYLPLSPLCSSLTFDLTQGTSGLYDISSGVGVGTDLYGAAAVFLQIVIQNQKHWTTSERHGSLALFPIGPLDKGSLKQINYIPMFASVGKFGDTHSSNFLIKELDLLTNILFEARTLCFTKIRVFHPHLGTFHTLKGTGKFFKRLQAPGFSLKQLVHKIVWVTIVEGPGDISYAQFIFLHLEEYS